jgi:hypothetical protein
MSTVAQLIDRINREYLYPPREQPSRTTLNGAINDSVTSVVYTDGILSVEEENALGEGVIVQVDRELMLVTAVNTGTWTLTVARGWLGTTAASHTDGSELVIAPDYPRQTVFDAVADSLEALYPDLYVIKTTESTVTGEWAVAPADVGNVKGANYYHSTLGWKACGVRVLKKFPDSGTGNAFKFAGGVDGARAYVTYKAMPTRITAETNDLADEYDDYYIDTTWEAIVILEAVANVAATLDLDAATQEFITQSIEAQGFDVGSGETVRDALLRFAGYKRTLAKKKLMSEESLQIIQSGYAYGDAG